ncbi:hypothetical protein OIE63_30165 [Streptomyces sp. NBC_01795]|uniref:hypothetical protein n=1 Tax=unclassified Streptomyces TaxID=2593676 RepID=UPI002DD9BD11|nr:MULTISPECIES: hypothetical protein [unclassified Streptomyces]WSA95349.1 hypothetical protein OIE63_30165 [Streptomyces sp. NBC_01795]WSB79767.1 hypothetical protein OHB04_31275 [Streptomyces sp. NBC_01775]
MGAAGIRTARAAVFTALCVTLSAGAHVLLSGSPVPLPPLVAISAGVFLLAFALAGRERGFTRIASLLIPLELAADTVFTTGQHACYGRAGGPVAGPLRSVGFDLLCGGGSVGTPLARMAARGGEAGALPVGAHGALAPAVPWLLLAAHICVGLLAAAWLRRGEAALAGLLRAVAATAFRPLRLAVAVCHTSPGATGPAPAPRTPSVRTPAALPLLTHSVHRRGPPALAVPAV